MRLIDADDLAAKIMMEAPEFMDGGSSITKAFILAMVKTRSVTPTIDAVQVVRCEDCAYALFNEGVVEHGHIVCTKPYTERWQAVKPNNWFCADGTRRDYVKPVTESATDWDSINCE